MLRFLSFTVCFLLLCSFVRASEDPLAAGHKPPPTVIGCAYGSDPRQVMDLWLPPDEADKAPRGLVLFLHGGGFLSGDKSLLPAALLQGCLERGLVVVAANYRFADAVPLPGPMLDAGRALQHLRAHAEQWNLDPQRAVLLGGSAGAGIALWLAFHRDLADPTSSDPVARQSTRPSCAIVWDAQTSYDPRFIARIFGPTAARHPALPTIFGLTPDILETPEAHARYQEASPIEHVHPGVPPVLLFYSDARAPLSDDAQPGDGMHHPAFGPPLLERMQAVGSPCLLRHQDDYAAQGGSLLADAAAFLDAYCPAQRQLP